MSKEGSQTRATGRKGAIKAAALMAFILLAIFIVRFTPVRDLLTREVLGRYLEAFGFWAPILFIVIYTAGICLFVPGSVLTALGAALFGPYRGFVYVWIGAMAGATASFWIGRTLGREFAASLIGDRLRKYDEAIERKGFATVLYLRLVYFPFTLMNFGMGLTRVRFWDYFLGTALGIAAGIFVITFFISTLKEVWASGEWGNLLSLKLLFSVALFVFSLFIPKMVKRFGKEGR